MPQAPPCSLLSHPTHTQMTMSTPTATLCGRSEVLYVPNLVPAGVYDGGMVVRGWWGWTCWGLALMGRAACGGRRQERDEATSRLGGCVEECKGGSLPALALAQLVRVATQPNGRT